jgi:DNA-binding MarR family transcriptional regulator
MTETASVLRALAGLELAALRHHRVVRARLNIGEEELAALLHLARHDGVPQRRLPEITNLSRRGGGAMILGLELEGFVVGRSDPTDRRLRFVELSAEGRERLRDAYRELGEAVERTLADGAPGALELLAGLLDGLADAVDEHGAHDAALAMPHDPIWRRWA